MAMQKTNIKPATKRTLLVGQDRVATSDIDGIKTHPIIVDAIGRISKAELERVGQQYVGWPKAHDSVSRCSLTVGHIKGPPHRWACEQAGEPSNMSVELCWWVEQAMVSESVAADGVAWAEQRQDESVAHE